MALPPFESLGNEYHQGAGERTGRQLSVAERHRRLYEMRQKIGEHILGEALHVASSLRRRIRDGVEPDLEPNIEIVDTYMESRFRKRKIFLPKRQFTVSHNSDVRGHYKGWRLVQAHWALGDYVHPGTNEDGGSMPKVTPDRIACRGIALLTDGRFLPYDDSTKQPHPTPDWQVDDAWKRDSLGCALVQESQVDENGGYDDTWPMHRDMREENGRWPATHPTWVLTAPGPDTGVYGRGLREGLAALARCHEIVIPEHIEPVQFIGNPFAHMEDGATAYGHVWGRQPRR